MTEPLQILNRVDAFLRAHPDLLGKLVRTAIQRGYTGRQFDGWVLNGFRNGWKERQSVYKPFRRRLPEGVRRLLLTRARLVLRNQAVFDRHRGAA